MLSCFFVHLFVCMFFCLFFYTVTTNMAQEGTPDDTLLRSTCNSHKLSSFKMHYLPAELKTFIVHKIFQLC